jgi:hypothetical protein
MATDDQPARPEQGIFDPKAASDLIKAIKEDLPGTIKVFEGLAARGATRTALAIGAALLVLPLANKTKFVQETTKVTLDTPEFIALITAGVFLLLIGAFVEVYNYKLSIDAGARLNEHVYQMSAQKNLYLLQLEAWTHQRTAAQAAKPVLEDLVLPPPPPGSKPTSS